MIKVRLFITLLLLGRSLQATPLPPPPINPAGGHSTTQMSFTNSHHDVIIVTNRITPVPDVARFTAKNPVVETGSGAAELPAQAPIHKNRIWLFAAIGASTLCLLLAISRKK